MVLSFLFNTRRRVVLPRTKPEPQAVPQPPMRDEVACRGFAPSADPGEFARRLHLACGSFPALRPAQLWSLIDNRVLSLILKNEGTVRHAGGLSDGPPAAVLMSRSEWEALLAGTADSVPGEAFRAALGEALGLPGYFTSDDDVATERIEAELRRDLGLARHEREPARLFKLPLGRLGSPLLLAASPQGSKNQS